MAIDKTRTAAYMGAGAAVGAGFATLRGGVSPRVGGLGLLTGVVASGVQSAVHEKTGSSELGWLAAIGSGAATGAVLLGSLGPAGAAPRTQRGIGAAIGAITGLLAPVVAGMILAQVRGSN